MVPTSILLASGPPEAPNTHLNLLRKQLWTSCALQIDNRVGLGAADGGEFEPGVGPLAIAELALDTECRCGEPNRWRSVVHAQPLGRHADPRAAASVFQNAASKQICYR